MKKIIALLLALVMVLSFASCTKKTEGNGTNDSEKSEQAKKDAIKLPDVVTGSMVFRDIGTVTFEIYPNQARQSCLNFIYLVNNGYYNGVIVDRLVKDFVIEAGDYQTGYVRRETDVDYTIVGEFSENGIENALHFQEGALAWVRTGDDYNSAHTEFAIYTDGSTSWDLDGKHAMFGLVTGDDSFKVLEKINKRKTYAEKPSKEIMITSVSLDPIDQEGFDPAFEFPEPNFIIADTTTASEG